MAEHNGVMREAGEEDAALWCRGAAAYVRHAVLARGSTPISVSFSCTATPDRSADVAIDWRVFVGRDRSIRPADAERAVGCAANLRSALREAGVREVRITGDLLLPLAVALGYEWRAPGGLTLELTQRVGAGSIAVSSSLLRSGYSVELERQPRRGGGPVVVVVSAPDAIDGATQRYADQVAAQEVITLHAPFLLTAPQIGGLAQQAARLLAQLADQGREKHLIVRGPMSLAVLIGAAGNTIGPTRVPLWDGAGGYLPGVMIGGGVADTASP
jgi:hypothetical protein